MECVAEQGGRVIPLLAEGVAERSEDGVVRFKGETIQ
jgi:hypothetical protein